MSILFYTSVKKHAEGAFVGLAFAYVIDLKGDVCAARMQASFSLIDTMLGGTVA